jgi:hypothetical protein
MDNGSRITPDEISAEELAEWQQGEIVVLPNKMMSLEYLQSIYRDKAQSLHVRMRAAAIALPFESPKLAVTAVVTDESLAVKLDRAWMRTKRAIKVIEPEPKKKEPPTVEIAPYKPHASIDVRRFRRRF